MLKTIKMLSYVARCPSFVLSLIFDQTNELYMAMTGLMFEKTEDQRYLKELKDSKFPTG